MHAKLAFQHHKFPAYCNLSVGVRSGWVTEEMAASKFEGNCLYNSFSMGSVRKSLIVIGTLFPFPFALLSTRVLY